uniref:L-lactate dehydrogenase n=1 Tax=Megaselia scalaris TaxID=36166 RepID=T1GRG4_MEGSC
MTSKLASCLLSKLADHVTTPLNKVTVVGCGQVGLACVMSLLAQKVTRNLCVIDVDEKRTEGEVLDFLHGSNFLDHPTIIGGKDYSLSINSRLIIVTAGVRQQPDETRLNLTQRNADLMKIIIPELVRYSPDAIILMVTNPVDIMTYVAWRISKFPRHRVIGSGTNLDSSRFRFLLSQKLGVSPKSIHAYIIGEHGDQSLPIWSGINVGSVNLKDINPDIGQTNDPEKFGEIHEQVVKAAYNIIQLKGYTNWAIGLSCIPAEGQHGIDNDVYLSLPCVVNSTGITHIVKLNLTIEERDRLRKSAEEIYKVQSEIEF